MNINDNSIVLYDGDCGFCNRSVQFILDKERVPFCVFVPQESTYGKHILSAYKVHASDKETLFFIEDGIVYDRSSAALQLAKYLRQPWKSLEVFKIIPTIFRDSIYDLIAKKRHLLLNNQESCIHLQPEHRSRFILE